MSSTWHETAFAIMGLFYNFTFVKMKGPNNKIDEYLVIANVKIVDKNCGNR